MLIVDLNRENYEYDVQALVKSFFPQEQVQVLTPATRKDRRLELAPQARLNVEITENGAELRWDGRLFSFCWPPEDETGADGAQASEPSRSALPASEQEALARVIREKGKKDGFKRFLYRLLCRETGKTLPWGNLTGIRPTKIAYGMLEQGRSDDWILEYYRQNHLVSREKAELALDIARREKTLLSRVHYRDGYSLYIGIPFCPTTCLYCSFPSYPISACRGRTQQYLDALLREMEAAAAMQKEKILDTVYIGGGTPTTLEAGQLRELIGRLRELFDFSTVQEFTVEAGRADSITPEKLEALREGGVDRISVNPQTMQERTLRLIGRQHTPRQVEEAFQMARRAGFSNINMDLILGLPGETRRDVADTVAQIERLSPESLTVHALAVKRASRMAGWIQENGMADLHSAEEMTRAAAAGALRMQMKPYYLYRQKNMSGNLENIGYAREGCFGLYNILIMEEKQTIVALGAGSISKRVSRRTAEDGRELPMIARCENVKEVTQYIERIDEMIERKRDLFRD